VDPSIPPTARHLRPGQHLVRHPDHPERVIDYEIDTPAVVGADGIAHVDYHTADGSRGHLAVDAVTRVTVKGAA
jgi:hypothetical protein